MHATGHANADCVQVRPRQQLVIIDVGGGPVFLGEALSTVGANVGDGHQPRLMHLFQRLGVARGNAAAANQAKTHSI